jgi:hypothetical protein
MRRWSIRSTHHLYWSSMSSRGTSAARRATILEPAGNLRGSKRLLLDFVAFSPNTVERRSLLPSRSPSLQELVRRRVLAQ